MHRAWELVICMYREDGKPLSNSFEYTAYIWSHHCSTSGPIIAIAYLLMDTVLSMLFVSTPFSTWSSQTHTLHITSLASSVPLYSPLTQNFPVVFYQKKNKFFNQACKLILFALCLTLFDVDYHFSFLWNLTAHSLSIHTWFLFCPYSREQSSN